MRIKAVLRDSEILRMDSGSDTRIVAAAKKNVGRVVNLASLLKVMGLKQENRIEMLQALWNSKLHIWLFQDAEQDLIFLSKKETSEDIDLCGYKWQ